MTGQAMPDGPGGIRDDSACQRAGQAPYPEDAPGGGASFDSSREGPGYQFQIEAMAAGFALRGA
jgi:hypothetical protein